MGGIVSLAASGFEESSLLQFIEHGFEQQVLSFPPDEPGAKFAEHRKMKPLIFEFEVKSILPIDTCTHRLSGLAVGKPFGELHQGHQRQLPRRKRGLTVFGKQISKHLILEKHPKLISHLDKGASLWACSFGDTSGFWRNRSYEIWLERHNELLLLLSDKSFFKREFFLIMSLS